MRVLVSGGGIAGNSVALQLVRAGADVTVVERARQQRDGGQAVGLRGSSPRIAERMGLMPGIDRHRLHVRGMVDVDGRGREILRTSFHDGTGPLTDIEITRGDLNQVLLEAISASGGVTDYRYGDHVVSLEQDDTGVEVAFDSGSSGRFDLVIAADGVRSAVRRMVFGPEEQFVRYLGGYMSFFTMPTPESWEPGWMMAHAVPNASIALRPDSDPAACNVMITLRAAADPALRGDVAAQQRFIRRMLAGAGWLAPAALETMSTAADFVFDELVRLDPPSLSKGRVVLLGDSGFCGSPMTGRGTAMAIVGAYVLAGELAAAPGDLGSALSRYEATMIPFLQRAKRIPGGGIKSKVPATQFGLGLAHLRLKAFASPPVRQVLRRLSGDQVEELPVYR